MNNEALRKAGWKIVYAKYLRGKPVIYIRKNETAAFKVASTSSYQTIEDLLEYVETKALEEITSTTARKKKRPSSEQRPSLRRSSASARSARAAGFAS